MEENGRFCNKCREKKLLFQNPCQEATSKTCHSPCSRIILNLTVTKQVVKMKTVVEEKVQ
jgi:hypothetical protein